jgi:polyribonucleotide nucleotidyltransferase
MDRPLRPLFPKGMMNEVQVIVTALARDPEVHLDTMSIIGASAAMTISNIPWEGPIGAVRVGFIDGQIVINPTVTQMASSTLDRAVGTADAILMVEAGADELPEDMMLEALVGHEATSHHRIRTRCDRIAPKFELTPKLSDQAVEQRLWLIARLNAAPRTPARKCSTRRWPPGSCCWPRA